MLWPWLLLGVLLVAALTAGVVLWRRRRRVEPSEPDIATARGMPAGSSPDYALTGNYWPTHYWAHYWPAAYLGGGAPRGHLLGSDQILAGRGVT